MESSLNLVKLNLVALTGLQLLCVTDLLTGFYSGLRRYIDVEWSTEASKCDSNTDCLEECTQHLGECLDSIFPTAEGCGVGRMLMDAILKLVNKTVGQISLVKPTLFKIALIVFGDNLNSFVIPR